MNEDHSGSDLFPDFVVDSISAASSMPGKKTLNLECEDSKTPPAKGQGHTTPTAKQILLKYQCMPHYPITEKSREQFESFIERHQNQTGESLLSNTQNINSIREHVIILHALFSKFCAPPPSIESICNIVLLETRRVAAVRSKSVDKSFISDGSANDLPKESMVHTSASSAQFVIAILKSPSKECLLKLPLEFQLSLFRILMRLLSEETDEEYDQECLFDWSFVHDGGITELDVDDKDRARSDAAATRTNIKDAELDGSYYVFQRGSSYSSNQETKSTAFKATPSHRTTSNIDIVTEAWNYGRWKKKKSSPLYSTIRFCSNLAWESNTRSSPSEVCNAINQRQRWDFVADNVKLDEEDENELNNENFFDDGSRSVSGSSVELTTILIRMYQSVVHCCMKQTSKPGAEGQYLLFGPVAHLLGLTISATGLSVKDLRKLLVMAEGSEDTTTVTSQNSHMTPQAISIVKLASLHVIRLLRYAAEYSTQSVGILDKIGPASFFSFGGSTKGLSTTLNKTWPFKHDFGVACWFRAENFVQASFRNGSGDNCQSTVLFRARTHDGGQIEISFESCPDGGDNLYSTAASLLVTVSDAHSHNEHKATRKVRLVGCVLSPSVWYHVAIRMTKSKPSPFALNFNKTSELSIFLNGKLMLRTNNMKLPRFPDSSSSGLSESLASVGLGSFGRQSANESKATNRLVEFTFFSNFDGQAGALYVFDEHVSDETIQSLYRATSGHSEQSAWFTFSDGWDPNRSKLSHISSHVSKALLLSELDDIVLPDYPILIGTVSRDRKVLIDVQDDDRGLSSSQGEILPRASFSSKLFMVWDPSRVNNSHFVVDLYSGVDVMLDKEISYWSFESIKDILLSLGGPKRLIPIFATLKAHPTMNYPQDIVTDTKGINKDFPNLFVPNILFLIASFVREHGANARELYRCGAVHVIHKILHDCKRRELESSHGSYYGMGASSQVAKYNVSALLDLWQSSRRVFGLEMIVFAQLLFNVGLLLGGVSSCNGVHLHSVLLPVLSEITRQNPDKVRDSVGTALFFDCVREYSRVENEYHDETQCSERVSINRSHLTMFERRIVVDFMLGMIVTMLAKSCPINDLSPLVTFLTYTLDKQWQQDNQIGKSTLDGDREKNCAYLAALKTSNVLFFLLQKSPPIPYLIDSLASLLGNGDGAASWMLCCMVNQFDDALRGVGIKCLVAYLHAALEFTSNGQDGSTVKLSNAVKYGLGVISNSSNVLTALLSDRGNVKVIYKLLWHLLKCHRECLGEDSYLGLMYLLVDNSSNDSKSVLTLVDVIVPNQHFHGGFLLDLERFYASQTNIHVAGSLSRQKIRNVYGVSVTLRLMRFMSNEQKERCLFDLLALVLASAEASVAVLSCDDWQPCLFQLVAEVIEEISGDLSSEGNGPSNEMCATSVEYMRKFDTSALFKPSVRTRYDLSLKLYSSLLGDCIRKGDDKGFEVAETAASLQRVDVNGPEVFGIVLSHLFADLIEKGTVNSVEGTYQKESPNIKNRALKQSARLVTQAILTNGQGELDMTAAVKQWRSLRHLTALAVAVVTDFGFGITALFDYQLHDGAAIDSISGGVYGIRLGDNLVSGINAFEAMASAQLYAKNDARKARNLQKRHRFTSVVLASQVLTLLDAFIFPDNLDSSTSATQLHGLALVRSSEPRLGQSQGPLLASLVRLSLVLLHFLEPCSVRFLQACSRLRCFVHWALEIIRESVALGGYSAAFHELTAPYDRIVLLIVLHCHRALSRCSTLLVEIESSPCEKHFPDGESRQKSHRRLFRAIMELREINLAVYKGRNEVLRASLSLSAHDALSRALEGGELPSPKQPDDRPPKTREDKLRKFLAHDWIAGFHDVQVIDNTIIPDSVGLSMGQEVFQILENESRLIIKDYKSIINAPWKAYCELQRRWAETDAVREMEHSGDRSVKRLSTRERSDTAERNKLLMQGFAMASQRFSSLIQMARDPCTKHANWRFSSYSDLLFRRIVLSRIRDFNDHHLASYELTLGKDREQLQEEEKLVREQEKIKEALLQAGEAIVPYQEDDYFEEDDPEESFVGWSETDRPANGESDDQTKATENSNPLGPASVEDKSATTDTRDKCDVDWDQLDFDEAIGDSDPYSWAKKFVWLEGETFVRTFQNVLIVTLQHNTKGTLLLTSQNLFFHQTGDVIDVMTREKVERPTQDRKWKLNRLTDIHGRRYMLKAQALELFFVDMHGVFIAFDGSKERDLFFSKLRTSCRVPLLRQLKSLNPRTIFKKSKITELWRKRKMSNFQYLMALNLMAGRTFNDITQYPVFPWILADYSSEELDLSDHTIYRDLSKPVGALNPDRLASLIERFNELDGFPEKEKFLYGSHYSSPGVVLHYMVRQEPFTSMHISLQSGRFDCPDRLFFDIGGCWRSCLSSTSDVKELTPEFFTTPEILLNTNSFPLGETQNKKAVNNVILPPWAKGSAHEFIRIHRLALESDYVSSNLHHWIDLIFGYKQRGPAAAEAHNIFHYLSYEGAVDIDKITDEVQRNAIEGHIQNFGQTPSQLIVKDPHPPRMHLDTVMHALCSEVLGYDLLQYHTPTKQFGGQRCREADGAIISLQLQGDSILAIHTDFTVCAYKIYASRGSIPFQFKQEKAKKLESKTPYLAQSSLFSLHNRELLFALAKNGTNKSDEPGSGGAETSFFLMSIGYYDTSVKVHFADSLQWHSTINGIHRGQINCIQVSSDGTIAVTGGEDCTCVIWVVDYEEFATSIADGVVQPGDEKSEDEFLRCCHVLLGHATPISCVAISTKLDLVVSGSRDGTICLHSIRSGRFIRSLHINAVSNEVENGCAGNGIPVVKLALHSDGIFVAHLCDGSLHAITVNGHHLASIKMGEMLNCMTICQHSSTLITGGEKGLTRMWNVHDLDAKCSVDVSKYGQITSMLLIPTDDSPISHFLCVGSENGLLSIVFRGCS